MPVGSNPETENLPILDISQDVLAILNDTTPMPKPKEVRLFEYVHQPEILNAPAVRMVLPWRPNIATWLKGWVESRGEQVRQAAVKCTLSQRKAEENAFASDVEWINSENE